MSLLVHVVCVRSASQRGSGPHHRGRKDRHGHEAVHRDERYPAGAHSVNRRKRRTVRVAHCEKRRQGRRLNQTSESAPPRSERSAASAAKSALISVLSVRMTTSVLRFS